MWKRMAMIGGGVLGAALIVASGAMGWVWWKSSTLANKVWALEIEPLEIPYPLSAEEDATIRFELGFFTEIEPALLDEKTEARRIERAIERGRHLYRVRALCIDCHDEDAGGKVVMDVPPVMGILAPNLTSGKGGIGAGYDGKSWVRILRHGVGRDGQASQMPAIDYAMLSDQEIADIATYVRSLPPVDRQIGPSYIGPVVRWMLATGEMDLSAYQIDHETERLDYPPAVTTPAAGRHLAQTCVFCHGSNFSGGPMSGVPPEWPPAANLTPHESGLAGWSLEDFKIAIQKGVSKDGHALHEAMPVRYLRHLSDQELQALWQFFSTLPPSETGTH